MDETLALLRVELRRIGRFVTDLDPDKLTAAQAVELSCFGAAVERLGVATQLLGAVADR